MSLSRFLKTFAGFGNIASWKAESKNVSYTHNEEQARLCFSKQLNNCPKPECQLKKTKLESKCIPNDKVSKWYVDGESKINSSTTGGIVKLVQSFLWKGGHINILDCEEIMYVLFPMGIGIQYPETHNDVLLAIYKLLDEDKVVVLCGHSTGCVLAQKYAVSLKHERVHNVFVVGSAPYLWATKKDVNIFTRIYQKRFVFFISYIEIIPFEYFTDPFATFHPKNMNPKNLEHFPCLFYDGLEIRRNLEVSSNEVEGLHAWNTYENMLENCTQNLHYDGS